MAPQVLPYAVRRSSRARRARLTVTTDGQVVVVLPQRAPLRAAALLVEQHTDWVRRQVDRARTQQAHLDARPALADGRALSVNGLPHDIVVTQDASARGRRAVRRVLLTDSEGIRGELHVTLAGAAPGTGVEDGLAAALETWLRAEARRVLAAQVSALAPRVGVSPGRLTVRAQRARWGSASRGGALSFNWRLILAPAFVLDAVVVHELAHLRIRGHQAAFWALVRAHAPRTDEARRWLREHHREVMAALDP